MGERFCQLLCWRHRLKDVLRDHSFAGLAKMNGGTGLEEGGTTAQLVFYKGVQWAEGKHE
jgi:hypothetical protein